MKRLAYAISLLVASSVATAADPQVGANQSLVLAYNQSAAAAPRAPYSEDAVSGELAENVMHQTLGVVSANLTYKLDSRIASKVPGIAH